MSNTTLSDFFALPSKRKAKNLIDYNTEIACLSVIFPKKEKAKTMMLFNTTATETLEFFQKSVFAIKIDAILGKAYVVNLGSGEANGKQFFECMRNNEYAGVYSFSKVMSESLCKIFKVNVEETTEIVNFELKYAETVTVDSKQLKMYEIFFMEKIDHSPINELMNDNSNLGSEATADINQAAEQSSEIDQPQANAEMQSTNEA